MNPIDRKCGVWPHPAVIAKNRFKGKSLSNWALNFAVGCTHACRFCYVPSSSVNKLKTQLGELGVMDPDEEWGRYAFLRMWDETKFLASLCKAQETPRDELKPEGNRAIMVCSTTDAYQLFRHADSVIQNDLNNRARWMVRRALELIRDHSDLRVRILTRSPLAREDFDLYRSFGERLLFGMSIPTLNDAWLRVYEPGAPGAKVRVATLQQAAEAGLHTFVAMAPTPPECDRLDYRRTLAEFKKLRLTTIFHEPINIRSSNVTRIERYAASIGVPIHAEFLKTSASWRDYAIQSLWDVAEVAAELGLGDVLHSWPDKALGTPAALKSLTEDEQVRWLRFFHDSWSRVSAWPGEPKTKTAIPHMPNSSMKNKTKPKTRPAEKDVAKAQRALGLFRPLREIAEAVGLPCESVQAFVQVENSEANEATPVAAALWIARLIQAGKVPVAACAIDGISTKSQFQYRAEVLGRVVEEYAELYDKGTTVPPVVLWQPPATNESIIVDGFHRVRACVTLGRQDVQAVIVRCPLEVAAMLPVCLNEVHGLRYGPSEKRRALETLFRAEPKLAKELRKNRKDKAITTDAIGAIYGASKATVSRALDDADDQAKLDFKAAEKIDYLEYDLSLTLLLGRIQYLTKEQSLPVSRSHLRDLAAIHVRLENLLCRLLDVDVRSLRKQLEAVSQDENGESVD